jgi:predicted RNA-binding Zn-ribbon protein involved in translation (DUF1610 family)
MMIEPRDVAARIPVCPKCGEKHFTYVMSAGLPLKVEKIRCAQCGANILRAYRAAQPAPFGLTVGQLDRLAVIVGALLLGALLLRLFFAR